MNEHPKSELPCQGDGCRWDRCFWNRWDIYIKAQLPNQ